MQGANSIISSQCYLSIIYGESSLFFLSWSYDLGLASGPKLPAFFCDGQLTRKPQHFALVDLKKCDGAFSSRIEQLRSFF